MVHMVLSIVVIWHKVDEFTLENFFLFQKKKEKEKEKSNSLAYSWDVVGNQKLDCRAWD